MENPFMSLPDAGGQQAPQAQGNPAANSMPQDMSQAAPQQAPAQQMQNPFMDLPPAQDSSSAFMAGVEGFNRQFEKMAIGTMQGVSQIGAKLGIPGAQRAADALTEIDQQGTGGFIVGDEQATKSFEEHPMAYGAGAVGGAIGSGVAYGSAGATGASMLFPKAAGAIASAAATNPIATRTAIGAAAGAGYGAMNPAANLEQRAMNTGISATVGGILPNILPLAKSFSSALTGSKNYTSSVLERVVSPTKAATKDIAYDVGTQLALTKSKAGVPIQALPDDAAQLDKLMASFRKLNINATPGQGTGSKQLLENEYSGVRGPVARRQASFYQQAEVDKLKAHVTNTIKNMAPDDAKIAVDEMYKELQGKTLTTENLDNLKTNPVVADYLGKIKELDIPQSALPDNDITKLDYIKQNIDDRLWNDNRVVDPANKLAKTVKDSLMTARNKVVAAIDSEYGDLYGPARQAAQKVALQEKYLNLIAKGKTTPGSVLNVPDAGEAVTIDQANALYNVGKVNSALFGDDAKIGQFLNDIKTVGGDTETAQAIIDVSNRFATTSVDKLLANSNKMDKGTYIGGDKMGMVQNFLSTLVNGKYEKAYINLITSGDKWVPLIKKEIMKQPSAAKKEEGFMKLILKAATQGKASSIVGSGVSNTIMPAQQQ